MAYTSAIKSINLIVIQWQLKQFSDSSKSGRLIYKSSDNRFCYISAFPICKRLNINKEK